MSAIDRSSPLPLWAQICEDLRDRAGTGEFDGRFPTEEELARLYGVSRQTVREAIRRLESEGLVVRQRGRGTRLVSRTVLEQPLHSLYSMATTVSSQGFAERSEVVARKRETPPFEAGEFLGSSVVDAIYIERIRFAGDDPIGWDRSWLPWDRAANLLEADLSKGGLYEALDRFCGIKITGGWEKIQPIVPSSYERMRLGISKDVGAFSINRLAISGNEAIEWRRSLIRGDRYALVANWPGGESPTL
ncbi:MULTISPECIES: GntR family transcriptional regulator [Acidithrix]|uniref:HTH-type transcriptional repressor YvoA n=1 Tax=Acidithrix ferrooxidans TaxID=1280514 RepID=A0A0D8HKC3_9ACTN|nr:MULTISPECIES: GntR family transcriptional regulator [Acidithrix]KJF18363.1 HTH-type transcriptional repressor YvoA [Acidithrix ferrooxidans]CAG4920823.1 unnamed protein product [Acidithrix sp. C25]